MKTIQEYSDIVRSADPIRVERTPVLNEKFRSIALDIYRCPVRNRNHRNFSVVEQCVEKMVLEHALSQKFGFTMNPLDFDHTNRQSYAYDLIDESVEYRPTFECKRFAETWFSFFEDDVKTFRKNIDIVDFLLSGKVYRTEEAYFVYFNLLADAKTFEKYVRRSQYTSKLYYDHNAAMRNGDAVFKLHKPYQEVA
jgi:hypothetical protein